MRVHRAKCWHYEEFGRSGTGLLAQPIEPEQAMLDCARLLADALAVANVANVAGFAAHCVAQRRPLLEAAKRLTVEIVGAREGNNAASCLAQTSALLAAFADLQRRIAGVLDRLHVSDERQPPPLAGQSGCLRALDHARLAALLRVLRRETDLADRAWKRISMGTASLPAMKLTGAVLRVHEALTHQRSVPRGRSPSGM